MACGNYLILVCLVAVIVVVVILLWPRAPRPQPKGVRENFDPASAYHSRTPNTNCQTICDQNYQYCLGVATYDTGKCANVKDQCYKVCHYALYQSVEDTEKPFLQYNKIK
jgi:hypothetical protein